MLSSLYVEGNGPLHRASAGMKLGGLALAGTVLFVIHTPVVLAVSLLVAATAYFTAGLPLRAALARLKPTLWSLVFLMILNLFLLPWQEVGILAMRILALVFAAAAVTATTPLADMMQAVDRLLRPLERMGLLRAGDAGLALGLCLRFIPDVIGRYHALAEAHKARGLKMRFATVIGPLIILTLKQADEVAAAIDARGLRAPSTPHLTRNERLSDR